MYFRSRSSRFTKKALSSMPWNNYSKHFSRIPGKHLWRNPFLIKLHFVGKIFSEQLFSKLFSELFLAFLFINENSWVKWLYFLGCSGRNFCCEFIFIAIHLHFVCTEHFCRNFLQFSCNVSHGFTSEIAISSAIIIGTQGFKIFWISKKWSLLI